MPYDVDAWIHPVTWGGIALARAVAIGIVVVSFLAGFAMTAFSEPY